MPKQLDRHLVLGRGQRIKQLRKLLGLNQRDFAAKAKVNMHTLREWEQGRLNGVSKKGANTLVDFTQAVGLICSLDWLLEGHEPGPFFVATQEGAPLEHQLEQIRAELEVFLRQPNTLSCQLQDDAMLPCYEKGDYVAGVLLPPETATGRNCIIECPDGSTLVRKLHQLKPTSKGYTATLIALNPEAASIPAHIDIPIVSAAPILFHRKAS